MSDPIIAFLRQPIEVLAGIGDLVAERVIHALSDWVRADLPEHRDSHASNRLDVIAAPETPWRIVVIVRQRDRHNRWVDVCAVHDAEASDLRAHFEPLTVLDHVSSIMEVKLRKLDSLIFSRVAESFDIAFYEQQSRGPFRDIPLIRRSHYNENYHLLQLIDYSAERWATSKARNQFKTLLDEAQERPQIVEREGGDLVVISRRYLQETVAPTSAKGLSRRYLAMGLFDDDMSKLEHGTLPLLEDLPEIGPA